MRSLIRNNIKLWHVYLFLVLFCFIVVYIIGVAFRGNNQFQRFFYIFTLVIIFGLVADYLYEFVLFGNINQSPLDITTYDGSNQPYHPSVVFINEGWQGHRYWMVETPYPIGGLPYRDRWECPTIHVSDDGTKWCSPANDDLKPIDDLTDDSILSKDYFSDPHLVFKNGILECFYRFSDYSGVKTKIYRKTSKDGIIWSERELLIDVMTEKSLNTVGEMVISPAVLWRGGKYLMWYVDSVKPFSLDKHIRLSTSPDGHTWSESKVCTLVGKSINPWHLDVTYVDDKYVMTIYDNKDLTLWISKDGNLFSFVKNLLSPTYIRGCFYSEGLYRSSLIKDDEGYKVYFSAYDTSRTYLGVMSGNRMENIKPISIDGRKHVGFWRFGRTYLSIWKHRMKW